METGGVRCLLAALGCHRHCPVEQEAPHGRCARWGLAVRKVEVCGADISLHSHSKVGAEGSTQSGPELGAGVLVRGQLRSLPPGAHGPAGQTGRHQGVGGKEYPGPEGE